MTTSKQAEHQAFAVGPAADRDALRSAAVAACDASAYELKRIGATYWCMVDVEDCAMNLARQLGSAALVYEIRLSNVAGGSEAHEGSIVGRRRNAAGTLDVVSDEAIYEAGFARGDALREVSMRYLIDHIEENASGAAPAREPEAGPIRNATAHVHALVEKLVDSGDLEIVNELAKQTLIEPLTSELETSSDVREAAEKIIEVLENAPEVAEVYAGPEEVESFLRARKLA